jgi:hypothetical protein
VGKRPLGGLSMLEKSCEKDGRRRWQKIIIPTSLSDFVQEGIFYVGPVSKARG